MADLSQDQNLSHATVSHTIASQASSGHTSTPSYKRTFKENVSVLAKRSVSQHLGKIKRGIEKESLRISKNGHLSQKIHPKELGSALTHPNITTDYSEALLELITEPHESIDSLLEQLSSIHSFVYQNINDELLWVNSMPCILGDDSSIPIANYGHSNIGTMKQVYRQGLGLRYGRLMQTIAGIHFNFSLPDTFWDAYRKELNDQSDLNEFISAHYFKLIRNFQRYAWLPIYLFGASPALCSSFVKNRSHKLEPMQHNPSTFSLDAATSLRMSDLGYQNDAQSGLNICYNSLESYTKSLEEAIRTPNKAYQSFGIKDDQQNYKQLNANILQIENEYYSNIRPKQTAKSGERPTQALKNRGVEYIEVRCLDLNPFEALGLDKVQIQFLDAFLLFCLTEDDLPSSPSSLENNQSNINAVVYKGRNPKAMIVETSAQGETRRTLAQAAQEALTKINSVAQLLDASHKTEDYQKSVALQVNKIEDPSKTPSGKIIADLEKNNSSFFEFALNKAQQHQAFFKNKSLTPEAFRSFQKLADESIQKQSEIERLDDISFSQFVENYFKN